MQLSHWGPPTPGLQAHSPLLGLQRVAAPERTEPTGWQEQAAEETGDRTRGLHVNISDCKSKDVSAFLAQTEQHSEYIMSLCVSKGQTHSWRHKQAFRVYTVNSHGNIKVKCILSSSCNKRQAGSMHSTCFRQLQQKQTVNHSLSALSELLPDARL